MKDNMRKRMCVCERERERLGHFAVEQKLTEHRKSTIIEKNFLKFKKHACLEFRPDL